MLRAILFDLDGVLVDSREAWFHLQHATMRDLAKTELTRADFDATWGQPASMDIDRWFRDRTVLELETYYEDHFAEHAHHVTVAADAARVLSSLASRGVRTALVTNSPRRIAHAVLGAAKLRLDAVVTASDVATAKPAPDMLLHAMRALDAVASEALMVGDTEYDRTAAVAAGVRFAGLGIPGDHSLQALADILEFAYP